MPERQHYVVLNEKNSDWLHISAGVPQGSVLGPLFFLVYINDLVDNISSDAKLFADDTSLFDVVYDEKPPGDSIVNQLIAITHQIHVAFEEYPSVVFEEYPSRELSKAFHKV